jgi:hypothetical protein
LKEETMTEHADYDDLAARAEAGDLQPVPGTALHGAAAAGAGRAALLAATGADTVEDVTRMALGRPRLGEDRRPSAVWKVRASAQLDDQVRAHLQAHGIAFPDLVRDAVSEYVQTHP